MKEGDNVKDNVALGVLRASSLWHHIKGFTDLFIPKETNVDIEVITNGAVGGAFRRSTLVVRLYDLKDIE